MAVTSEQAARIIRDYEAEAAARAAWVSVWQEISEWMLPSRASFTTTPAPGADRRGGKLLDTTAEQAIEDTAAGLHGMFTSAAQRWFMLRPAGPVSRGTTKQVLMWLGAVMEEAYGVLNSASSQFHPQMDAFYQDMIGFGTSILNDEETNGDERSPVVYRTLHLAGCYPRPNRFGTFDTMYRCVPMSYQEIVDRWGEGVLTEDMRLKYQRTPNEQINVIHAVQPRRLESATYGSKGYPFASVWIVERTKHVLHEGGYQEFPYHIGRWRVRTGEVFGVGPGLRMLPETKMLNEMARTVLKAAQLAIQPPLQAPDRNFLGPVRTYPNAISYYRTGSQDRIEPIYTAQRVDIGERLLQQQRDLIRRGFFADAFQITSDSDGVNVKATFTMQRRDDQFRRLAPISSRMEQMFTSMLARLYRILKRAGRIPPPPPEIEAFDIEYVSPVARAMRTAEADDIFRLLELAAPLGEIDPSALANIDANAAVRIAGTKLFNVPAEVMRSEREVRDIQDQQREQQKSQQALEQGGVASAALKDVAHAANLRAG